MSDENDKGSSVSDDAPDSGASSSQSPASSIQNGKKNKKPPVDELSAEDKALKESLELLVLRVRDPIAGVARLALETMRIEIRTSTSSMTSVPKPLKFLRAHYPTLANDFKTPEVVPDAGTRDQPAAASSSSSSSSGDVPLTFEQLSSLVDQIAPYNMAHNAEHEA